MNKLAFLLLTIQILALERILLRLGVQLFEENVHVSFQKIRNVNYSPKNPKIKIHPPESRNLEVLSTNVSDRLAEEDRGRTCEQNMEPKGRRMRKKSGPAES